MLPVIVQCLGQHHYVVRWIDSLQKTQKTGLLNVIPSGVESRHLWLNEIEAARALQAGHPNIAHHLWSSPTNVFSDITANTMVEVSCQSSM
jgi:hypothetical protein